MKAAEVIRQLSAAPEAQVLLHVRYSNDKGELVAVAEVDAERVIRLPYMDRRRPVPFVITCELPEESR